MKVKFRIVLANIVLILSQNKAFSQTPLELLWEKALQNSLEIRISSLELDNTEISYKARNAQYIPSFSFSAYSEFIESEAGLTQFPIEGISQLGIQWNIPGGTKLQTSISYEINRYVLNSLEEESYENTGYDQNPEISVSLSQSLLPFWIQWMGGNPVQNIYKNQRTLSVNSYNNIIADVKKSVTEKYIQLRKLYRTIHLLENQIQIQRTLLEVAQQKVYAGTLSQIELWNYESNLQNYKNNLNETLFQFEQIKQEISNACGEDEFNNLDAELPSYKIRFLEKDMTLEFIELQKAELKNQLIITKQNYAPSFTIQGSYKYALDAAGMENLVDAWDGEGVNNWTVTCGISIYPENLSYIKTAKLQYEINKESLELQEAVYIKNKNISKANLQTYIAYYKELLQQAKSDYEQKNIYLDAIKNKKKRGECTELDVKQAELMRENASIEIKNLEDVIWYYQFLEYQYL